MGERRSASRVAGLLAIVLASGASGSPHPSSNNWMQIPGYNGSDVQVLPGGVELNLFSGQARIVRPLCSLKVSDRIDLTLNATLDASPLQLLRYWDEPYYGYWQAKDSGFAETGAWWNVSLGCIRRTSDPGGEYSWLYLTTPDGVEHRLYSMATEGLDQWTLVDEHLITRDGSRIRVTWNYDATYDLPGVPDWQEKTYKAFMPDGTIYQYDHFIMDPQRNGLGGPQHWDREGWWLTTIIDPFGNRVDINYYADPSSAHLIRSITDSHGRVISTAIDPPGTSAFSRIRSVSYPAFGGQTATTQLIYESPARQLTVPDNEEGDPAGWTSPVEVLSAIRYPDGSAWRFDYNEYGELASYTLPAGGRVDLAWETSTWTDPDRHADDDLPDPIFMGRGIVAVQEVGDHGDLGLWEYSRNQVSGEDCVPARSSQFMVNVRDPEEKVRTYKYVPAWWADDQFGTEAMFPTMGLLESVTVWDVPFPSAAQWPHVGLGPCGEVPPGIHPYLVIEHAWEIDEIRLFVHGPIDYRNVLTDASPRIVRTKITYDDGTWSSTDHCGWDGFGHFRAEVLRGSNTNVLATPRTTRRIYKPLVRNWILDTLGREEVAENGQAAVTEWYYDSDGRVYREVHRAAFQAFPPAGLSNAESIELQCTNADIDTNGSLRILPDRWFEIEEKLRENECNWPDLDALIGPFPFDPAPLPPNFGCMPDFYPPDLPASASGGDTMTSYSWYSSVLSPLNDPASPRDFGQLKYQTMTSTDPAAGLGGELRQIRARWIHANLASLVWMDHSSPTMPRELDWRALDRDIDANTGLPAAQRDASGLETTFDFDALGRLRKIVPPMTPGVAGAAALEAPTTIDFSSDGRQIDVVKRLAGSPDEEGTEYYEDLDEFGRIVSEQSRVSATDFISRTRTRDVLGRVEYLSSWMRSPETPHDANPYGPIANHYAYSTTTPGAGMVPDPLGRLRKVSGVGGFELDYSGLKVSSTVGDIAGPLYADATTETTLDMLGRVRAVDAPSQNSAFPAADALYDYDVHDNLRKVTLHAPGTPASEDQVRSWIQDGTGRLRSTTQPESGLTRYLAYDALGGILRRLDADGDERNLQFDWAGRLLRVGRALPTGGTEWLVERAYDEALHGDFSEGRLTSLTARDPSGIVPTLRTDYHYQGLSGGLSRMVTTHGALTWSATQEFDALANILSIKYPSLSGGAAGGSVTRTYRFGRLTTVGDDANPTRYLQDAYWTGAADTLSLRLGNGTRHEMAFNNAGFLSSITVRDAVGAEIWGTGPYVHDLIGNIASIGPSLSGNPRYEFQYDDNGRLISWSRANQIANYFAYDAFGNMTSNRLSGSPQVPCGAPQRGCFTNREFRLGPGNAPGVLVTNRISAGSAQCFPTAQFQYENSGNVTRDEAASYAYNALDQLITMSPIGQPTAREDYAYDGEGNRGYVGTLRQPAIRARHEIRWPDGGLAAEWLESTSGAVTPSREFIQLPGSMSALRDTTGPSARLSWLHSDHLGSVRAVTDQAGAVSTTHEYLPFGPSFPDVPAAGLGGRFFAGHDLAGDGGTVLMGARTFSARQGRFMSPDDSARSISLANPQSWNRYAYASNNPAVMLDVTGQYSVFYNGTWQNDPSGLQADGRRYGMLEAAALMPSGSVGVVDGAEWGPGEMKKRRKDGQAMMAAGQSSWGGAKIYGGFSHGAIEALGSVKHEGGPVDLVFMIDPELKSHYTIPANARYCVFIDDGNSFFSPNVPAAGSARAADPAATQLVSIRVQNVGAHGMNDNIIAPFVSELAQAAECGTLNMAFIYDAVNRFNANLAASNQPWTPLAIVPNGTFFYRNSLGR